MISIWTKRIFDIKKTLEYLMDIPMYNSGTNKIYKYLGKKDFVFFFIIDQEDYI